MISYVDRWTGPRRWRWTGASRSTARMEVSAFVSECWCSRSPTRTDPVGRLPLSTQGCPARAKGQRWMHRDTPRHAVTHKDTQRLLQRHAEPQRDTETHWATQTQGQTETNTHPHTKIHRDAQWLTQAHTDTQRHRVAPEHTQRHKDTVMRRSMQRHAETRRRLLIGNCWPMLMRLHACRGKPVSVPSNPCAHRSNARGLWRSQCFRACHLLQMAGQRDITCLEACMCLRVWLGIWLQLATLWYIPRLCNTPCGTLFVLSWFAMLGAQVMMAAELQ